MKIAVCVARTVGPEAKLSFGGDVAGLEIPDVDRPLGQAETCALEQALRLADSGAGVEVVVLGLGPPDSESVLRRSLALGADTALLLRDERIDGCDSLATARVLAAAIRRLDPDFVLCGDRASDGNSGQVGPQLAELLDVPGITGVLHVEITGRGELRVSRKLDHGLRCALRLSLPALLTVEAGVGQRRYPRLRDRLWAQTASIPSWDLDRLGLTPAEVGEAGVRVEVVGLSPPKPTTRDLFVPDAELSPEERWEQIISGGAGSGPASGPAPQATDPVQQIVAFLEDGRYL